MDSNVESGSIPEFIPKSNPIPESIPPLPIPEERQVQFSKIEDKVKSFKFEDQRQISKKISKWR